MTLSGGKILRLRVEPERLARLLGPRRRAGRRGRAGERRSPRAAAGGSDACRPAIPRLSVRRPPRLLAAADAPRAGLALASLPAHTYQKHVEPTKEQKLELYTTTATYLYEDGEPASAPRSRPSRRSRSSPRTAPCGA